MFVGAGLVNLRRHSRKKVITKMHDDVGKMLQGKFAVLWVDNFNKLYHVSNPVRRQSVPSHVNGTAFLGVFRPLECRSGRGIPAWDN